MAVGPRTIYLIRHAEKPGDPGVTAAGVDEAGQPNVASLTPRGWQRAGALVALFDRDAAAPDAVGPRPTVLISPDYGADSAQHRTVETITPLSRRLGVPITEPQAKGSETALAQGTIMGLTDADLLVCWEHHHIPAIVAALGSVARLAALPPLAISWPDDEYSGILVFTRTDTGGYDCRSVHEHILDGDATN
ncbi:MAG TPA: hypothetical protein VGK53_21010 [Propionicimonas sp.]|jgi:hypothetical protein